MFKFDLGQRVVKPNSIGIQAVVCARMDYVRGEPAYRLDWVASNGGEGSEWFIESILLEANTELPAADTLAAASADVVILDIRPKPAAIVTRVRNRKGKPARKKR